MFKIRNISLLVLYLCLNKSLCSKQIAEILHNPHNDRNIQKVLLNLERQGLMKFVGIGINSNYKKSKFFIVNKDVIAKNIIESRKIKITKAKQIGCDVSKEKLPTRKEAIEEFEKGFEVFHSKGKNIIYFDKTGKKNFIKLAEI